MKYENVFTLLEEITFAKWGKSFFRYEVKVGMGRIHI